MFSYHHERARVCIRGVQTNLRLLFFAGRDQGCVVYTDHYGHGVERSGAILRAITAD